MANLMESLQKDPMVPPPSDSTRSSIRRDSEASPSRSSFPSSNASRIHTPPTSIPSTPIIPTRLPSPEKRVLYSGEPDAFLTAVAAQERRVLELKEELQKAEVDLGKLKKQWAAHEAKKKRNEVRNAEQLQPIKTSFPEHGAMCEENPVSASRELDRRKTLSSGTKFPQRKVISGSRHTRTLSLLSSNRLRAEPHYSPRGDCHDTKRKGGLEAVEAIPEIAVSESPPKLIASQSKSSDRDLILETGKQLVGDFRQGFWTFVEDLKQVTVGNESSPVEEAGVSPKGFSQGHKKVFGKSREAPSVDSAAGKPTQKDAWSGHIEQKTKSNQANEMVTGKNIYTFSKVTDRLQQGLALSTDSDNEGWENWDTNGPPDLVPAKDLKSE